MATPPLPAEKRQRVIELLNQKPRKSFREISRITGVSGGAISNIATDLGKGGAPACAPDNVTEFEAAIRKQIAKQPMNKFELADSLDCGPSKVEAAIASMQARHMNVHVRADGRYDLAAAVEPGGRVEHAIKERGDGWQVFGFITDSHLCNRHERLDVNEKLYDRFAAEGVTKVYHGGNYIDGEAKFNKYELKVFGMDGQVKYFIDKWPQRKGITTYFIDGDDHEGWYAQRECIKIGAYVEMMAQKAGREDLKYLGYMEHDVALKHGTGEAVMRIQHGGGGSAYAVSYTPQKIVESYQGGEKPHILLLGHYHKFDYCYPREVHTVHGGCTEDQTMFMRKKKIAAHVGGCLIWLKQDERGAIERFRVEWIPFYDRGYYGSRFD